MTSTDILRHTVENLPRLPNTVANLRKYISMAGDNFKVSEIARIMGEDPSLIAQTLKVANSAMFGSSHHIATIEQAISLIGISNLRGIVLDRGLQSSMRIDVSPYGLDSEIFMRECALESQFITSWLGQEDKALSQLLMPCAMLLRLGVIVFSASLKRLGKGQEFFEKIKANNFKNIALVEMEYFRVDSFSFLNYLFRHWEFDESLIMMMGYCIKPYAAPSELKKGAYALAVVNTLFGMHSHDKKMAIDECVEVLQDAQAQGVRFSTDNFLRNAQKVKF